MAKGASKKGSTRPRLLVTMERAVLKRRIGERLRRFRKARGYSILELEALTGIDEANLRKHESGYREPTLSTIVIISRALKVSPLKLLDIDYDLVEG